MNFLAGLQNLSSDPLADLTESDRVALQSFRAAHNANAPEGSDSQKPTYKLTAPLPESGWRALDDLTLWRFLRADMRKGRFDQRASLKRLTSTLQWRKANDVDTVRDKPPAEVLRASPVNINARTGLDDGKPPNMVTFTRLGELAYSGHTNQLTADEWCVAVSYELEGVCEEMRAHAARTGEPVWKQALVADLQDALRSPRMAWRYLRHLGKAINLDVHYPEVSARIVFVNCSPAFTSFYNRVAVHFVDSQLAAKFQFFTDPAPLLTLLPPRNVFREYGGTNDGEYPHVPAAYDIEPSAAALLAKQESYKLYGGDK